MTIGSNKRKKRPEETLLWMATMNRFRQRAQKPDDLYPEEILGIHLRKTRKLQELMEAGGAPTNSQPRTGKWGRAAGSLRPILGKRIAASKLVAQRKENPASEVDSHVYDYEQKQEEILLTELAAMCSGITQREGLYEEESEDFYGQAKDEMRPESRLDMDEEVFTDGEEPVFTSYLEISENLDPSSPSVSDANQQNSYKVDNSRQTLSLMSESSSRATMAMTLLTSSCARDRAWSMAF